MAPPARDAYDSSDDETEMTWLPDPLYLLEWDLTTLIADYPRCFILVWAICIAVTTAAVVLDEPRVDRMIEDPSSNHARNDAVVTALRREILSSLHWAAGHNTTCPPQPPLPLRSRHAYTMQAIYDAHGANLLTPAPLAHLHRLEEQVLGSPLYATGCLLLHIPPPRNASDTGSIPSGCPGRACPWYRRGWDHTADAPLPGGVKAVCAPPERSLLWLLWNTRLTLPGEGGTPCTADPTAAGFARCVREGRPEYIALLDTAGVSWADRFALSEGGGVSPTQREINAMVAHHALHGGRNPNATAAENNPFSGIGPSPPLPAQHAAFYGSSFWPRASATLRSPALSPEGTGGASTADSAGERPLFSASHLRTSWAFGSPLELAVPAGQQQPCHAIAVPAACGAEGGRCAWSGLEGGCVALSFATSDVGPSGAGGPGAWDGALDEEEREAETFHSRIAEGLHRVVIEGDTPGIAVHSMTERIGEDISTRLLEDDVLILGALSVFLAGCAAAAATGSFFLTPFAALQGIATLPLSTLLCKAITSVIDSLHFSGTLPEQSAIIPFISTAYGAEMCLVYAALWAEAVPSHPRSNLRYLRGRVAHVWKGALFAGVIPLFALPGCLFSGIAMSLSPAVNTFTLLLCVNLALQHLIGMTLFPAAVAIYSAQWEHATGCCWFGIPCERGSSPCCPGGAGCSFCTCYTQLLRDADSPEAQEGREGGAGGTAATVPDEEKGREAKADNQEVSRGGVSDARRIPGFLEARLAHPTPYPTLGTLEEVVAAYNMTKSQPPESTTPPLSPSDEGSSRSSSVSSHERALPSPGLGSLGSSAMARSRSGGDDDVVAPPCGGCGVLCAALTALSLACIGLGIAGALEMSDSWKVTSPGPSGFYWEISRASTPGDPRGGSSEKTLPRCALLMALGGAVGVGASMAAAATPRISAVGRAATRRLAQAISGFRKPTLLQWGRFALPAALVLLAVYPDPIPELTRNEAMNPVWREHLHRTSELFPTTDETPTERVDLLFGIDSANPSETRPGCAGARSYLGKLRVLSRCVVPRYAPPRWVPLSQEGKAVPDPGMGLNGSEAESEAGPPSWGARLTSPEVQEFLAGLCRGIAPHPQLQRSASGLDQNCFMSAFKTHVTHTLRLPFPMPSEPLFVATLWDWIWSAGPSHPHPSQVFYDKVLFQFPPAGEAAGGAAPAVSAPNASCLPWGARGVAGRGAAGRFSRVAGEGGAPRGGVRPVGVVAYWMYFNASPLGHGGVIRPVSDGAFPGSALFEINSFDAWQKLQRSLRTHDPFAAVATAATTSTLTTPSPPVDHPWLGGFPPAALYKAVVASSKGWARHEAALGMADGWSFMEQYYAVLWLILPFSVMNHLNTVWVALPLIVARVALSTASLHHNSPEKGVMFFICHTTVALVIILKVMIRIPLFWDRFNEIYNVEPQRQARGFKTGCALIPTLPGTAAVSAGAFVPLLLASTPFLQEAGGVYLLLIVIAYVYTLLGCLTMHSAHGNFNSVGRPRIIVPPKESTEAHPCFHMSSWGKPEAEHSLASGVEDSSKVCKADAPPEGSHADLLEELCKAGEGGGGDEASQANSPVGPAGLPGQLVGGASQSLLPSDGVVAEEVEEGSGDEVEVPVVLVGCGVTPLPPGAASAGAGGDGRSESPRGDSSATSQAGRVEAQDGVAGGVRQEEVGGAVRPEGHREGAVGPTSQGPEVRSGGGGGGGGAVSSRSAVREDERSHKG